MRYAIVGATIALFLAMAIRGARDKSAVFDEVAHVTAGYSYWTLNDYRLQPENGNWPQRLAGLPVLRGELTFPRLDQPVWRQSDVWGVGDQFFYSLGNDAARLLFPGRIAIALVAAALAVLVFAWARSLFGDRGGWIALTLFVFNPTMLAHGALATSDMMASAFFTAGAWALWKVMHRVSVGTLAASTVAVAGLFLSKYSAPIIMPVAAVMVVARLLSSSPVVLHLRRDPREITSRFGKLAALSATAGAHVVVAWILIWASYGFRFNAFATSSGSDDQFLTAWSRLLANPGAIAQAVAWVDDARLLPESWLYGFSYVLFSAENRVAFLNGVTSEVGGLPGFFPYTALVKESLPTLALIVAGAGAAVWRQPKRSELSGGLRRLGARLYDLTPLLALIVVYWLFAVSSNLNIGHRHLLPIIPAALVLAGASARFIEGTQLRHRIATAAVVALCGWHAIESVRVSPNYLAYFNQIAGGPANGYRHLVDSSLDWGQDLPGLKKWLDEKNPEGPNHSPVFLSYFGSARPAYYGIQFTRLPSFSDDWTPQEPQPLSGGTYCISATMLQGPYLDVPGEWSTKYEEQYQASLQNLRLWDSTSVNAATRAALIKQTGEQFWQLNFHNFDQLRFGRLAAFLRAREPDVQIGHSIMIYQLSDAQVREALNGPAPFPRVGTP